MKRLDLLSRAARLVSKNRADVHGDATEVHARIAALWSAWLGIPLTPADVVSLMVLFKLGRARQSPFHEDNYVDIIGYAALAGEFSQACAGLPLVPGNPEGRDISPEAAGKAS